VNVRGCVVPVLDLRLLLDRERTDLPHPCVIIITHESRLLGLLADRVTGIFASPADSFRRLSVLAGATIIAGSTSRPGTDGLVTVLSPAALALWPQVPWVDDPVPAGEGTIDAALHGFDQRSMPLMLLRCRRIGMAIDAMAVHSTLANPDLGAPAVAVEVCRGSLEYTGQRIPAVDLLALCGLGRLDTDRPIHAFVMQLDAGFVAFLVDEVIDVVRTRADQITGLATYALPEPGLFKGALPAAAVAAVFTALADHTDATTSQYLLFDTAALAGSAIVSALAGTNTPLVPSAAAHGEVTAQPLPAGSESQSSGPAQAGGRNANPTMITFDLGSECATPMSQILEILAYEPASAVFASDGPLIGLVVNRGRSIPVFCLRRLAGLQSLDPGPDTRVLIVEAAGECTGFVVPHVRAIEPSHWNPILPATGPRARDAGAQLREARTVALVGSGTAKRMLRVFDLEGVAKSLRGPQAPCNVAAS
jgi:purine-binding chemotaxis protein CheW